MTTMKRTRLGNLHRAAAVTASILATSALSQTTPTALPVVPLSAGIHVIKAEIAQNSADRSRGLMHRTELGANQGMLFLFERDDMQCMWMRNTLIGLSVAFIDANGRIVNIEDMAPQTEDNHCAKTPARYALEMNRGWFAKHGVKAGAAISGLPKPTR